MKQILMALRNAPHPEREPERSGGEQSKDATPVIQVSDEK
jgi:hypothetical protein